jgi:NADPH:quinone reductase-like Zn-dependent oxidoreductase
MRAWTVRGAEDLSGFELIDRPRPKPGELEVGLRLRAASLNYRDLMIAAGQYPLPVSQHVVPLSDACWEVVELGASVDGFQLGDRVINIFCRDWIDGPYEARMWPTAFGAEIDGVLVEERNMPATALVNAPPTLSDEEAATIPCAGVTAWTALFEGPLPLKPGQTVLTLGTGGVSTFALQLAKAAGARVIVTSSSDEKLKLARKLGADVLINYERTSDWDRVVRESTGGVGADLIVEVGGPGTLPKSLAALRSGGEVALVGALSEPQAGINPATILLAHAKVRGIMVGSRRHSRDLVRAIAQNGIKPVVHKVFDFAQAALAFSELRSGHHSGKIVIKARSGSRQQGESS